MQFFYLENSKTNWSQSFGGHQTAFTYSMVFPVAIQRKARLPQHILLYTCGYKTVLTSLFHRLLERKQNVLLCIVLNGPQNKTMFIITNANVLQSVDLITRCCTSCDYSTVWIKSLVFGFGSFRTTFAHAASQQLLNC